MAACSFEIDQVFILRFWCERDAESRMLSPWRARVVEINTGTKRHVGSVDEALNFVRNHLATIGESNDPGRVKL